MLYIVSTPIGNLEDIFKPFNANGKEIAVNTVEEAKTLMQLGANYTKKMQGIAPYRKVGKLLEDNDLLDEDKLRYAVDLLKHDKDAIAKLLKDSEVDPMDLDTTEDIQYSPKVPGVSDTQLELQDVLSQIEDSPSYLTTIEVIGKQWDDSSKQVLGQNPQLIAEINKQVEDGRYSIISAEVSRQQSFGGLQGLSDLQAYNQVGNQLIASGQITANGVVPAQQPEIPNVDAKKVAERKQKRKAASPTKATKRTKPKTSISPLSMSEEELNKLDISKFI